jgi:SAM-dependent methyltransferase
MLAPGHIAAYLRKAGWIARSLMTDLRYGGVLRGDIRSRYRKAGAYNVVNSPYSVLAHIFRGRIGPQDVLVDVGCGKGRVINWWLDQGLRNRIVGLEIDPDIASAAARRLSRFGNVMIIHDDATTAVPDDATLLYMYNPFDRAATTRFKDNLARKFCGRGITALYWNPQWLEVFEGDPRWTTQLIELTEVSDPRIGGMDRKYAVVALRPA